MSLHYTKPLCTNILLTFCPQNQRNQVQLESFVTLLLKMTLRSLSQSSDSSQRAVNPLQCRTTMKLFVSLPVSMCVLQRVRLCVCSSLVCRLIGT